MIIPIILIHKIVGAMLHFWGCFTGDPSQNVILWMDHRASEEVGIINATGHKVLNSVGGIMSLEMQSPKLMWLKKVKIRQLKL